MPMQVISGRGNRLLTNGAETIFWTGGARPRAPKSGTRNRGLHWNWRVFNRPGNKRSQKKVFAGFGTFIQVPAPPTSRAYAINLMIQS